jgi:protein gp37
MNKGSTSVGSVDSESGYDIRPLERVWVTELRDQCLRAEVLFIFKQWGGTNKKKAGRVLEGRTWDEIGGGFEKSVTCQTSLC